MGSPETDASGEPLPGDAHGPRVERLGESIGPYRLLREIGEGGYGVVYLAEQNVPIRRQVAVKVIKLGMDTKEVIARFEAERQALALMDHPNIARVLDAGATRAGRPYFVMELVEGVKITRYCDDRRLNLSERMSLFVQVCQGIQHAHQKGVIHRDIKPSNVLVASGDAVPVPKIIDFGIAKATGQRLTEKTLLTTRAQVIGTPTYMSPEQARLTSQDIDTRSDIYSLGVLLYELLSGQTPFDTQRLREADIDEIRRIIREEDPLRPSVRLGSLDVERRTTVASQRHLPLPRLISLVRGDLDWIVMKCLEKDRARRYESASALAEDIGCYLRHEPVSAAAPTTFYRVRKLIRRHRGVVAAVSTFVLLLLAGVVVSTWQAVRATTAEQAAQSEYERAEREAATAEGQKLEAQRLQQEADAERVKAEEASESAQASLQEAREALLAAKEAQIREQEARRDADAERERAQANLQTAQRALREAERAQRAEQDARQEAERLLDFLLFDLSKKLLPIGRADLLRSVSEEALKYYQEPVGEDTSIGWLTNRYEALKNLGTVLAAQGEGKGFRDSQLQCLDLAERLEDLSTGGEQVRWLGEKAACRRRLGEFSQSRGDLGGALEEFRKSLRQTEQLLEEDPDNLEWKRSVYETRVRVGESYRSLGETPRALEEQELALRIAQGVSQQVPQDTTWQGYLADSWGRIGLLQAEEALVDEAKASCERGLQIAQQLAEAEPVDASVQAVLALAHERLGDVLLGLDAIDEAFEHYQKAMDLRRRRIETDPESTEAQRALLRSTIKLGSVLTLQSDEPRRWQAFLGGLEVFADIHRRTSMTLKQVFSPDDLDGQRLTVYGESVDLAQRLSEKDPDNLVWKNDLAQSRELLADLLIQSKEEPARKRALQEYRGALHLREAVAGTERASTAQRLSAALCRANVAAALQRLDHETEAMVEARAACAVLVELASQWPGNLVLLHAPQPKGRNLRQEVRMIAEQGDRLTKLMKKGLAAAEREAKQESRNIDLQEDLAVLYEQMAMCCLLFESKGEALHYAQQASTARRGLSLPGPFISNPPGRRASAGVLLGVLYLINGHAEAARTCALQGLEVTPTNLALEAVAILAEVVAGKPVAAILRLRALRFDDATSGESFMDGVMNDLSRLESRGLLAVDGETFEALLGEEATTVIP